MKHDAIHGEDASLDSILKEMCDRHGIDFSLYRRNTIERRIAKRMASLGASGYRDYLPFLLDNPAECDLLLRDLTLKVSRFFRNRPLFDLLASHIFPSLLKEKEILKERTLRIWCAGCACGEEAYSVAISLMECLQKRAATGRNPHVSIFGTDVDEDALRKASEAAYRIEALREIPQEMLKSYFIPLESNSDRPDNSKRRAKQQFRLVDSIRELVHFSRHDIASDTKKSPPAGVVANYDVILCRNLLIYFSRPLQEKALLNLYNSLNLGGYLILGKSESIPESHQGLLVPVNASMKVYRRALPTTRERFP